MQRIPGLAGLALLCWQWSFVLASDAMEEAEGLIIPRDDSGMYLRTAGGQVEVEWTAHTEVALVANTRLFSGIKDGRLEYAIHSSKEVIEFALPEGPVTAIREVRGGKQLETALAEARQEKWIAEFGLRLRFGETPAVQQLPTESDRRFVGIWDSSTKPRTIAINGQTYEISLKKGGQTDALLFNVLTIEDCAPFINRARAVGRFEGDKLIADEIHVTPIGDQAAKDDPDLPRYLYIGDSISGNYSAGLRQTLEGIANLHHPPTNCGPSAKGVANLAAWLGAYEQPGREWDVISFNFGHWDAANDRESYQRNLETIIAGLKPTGARLIWVTTCPVPDGFPAAGALDAKGKAPGRTAGVMEKYLNRWAAEVLQKHPEIAVCDQWQLVKDGETGLFADWWKGSDVHFRGEQADALGKLLGKQVAGLLGEDVSDSPTVSREVMPEPVEVLANTSDSGSIPLWSPDYQYETPKRYGLHGESDVEKALPDAWRDVELHDPVFAPTVSELLVPQATHQDDQGRVFDISPKPSMATLSQLKSETEEGIGMGYYFLPREERYRNGPGLTGAEILDDLKSGKFPEDSVHSNFIYGFYFQNVMKLYRLYRVSSDPWYGEELARYADGIDWLLDNRPQQLIPLQRRDDPIGDWIATIPHEPAAASNFWAHSVAARVLLELAAEANARPDDRRVVRAKSYLSRLVKYMDSQITTDYRPFARRRNEEPTKFEPGERTQWLRNEYDLPPRAAQIIEYTPWNQTFFYFAVLAGAVEGLELLAKLENSRNYDALITLYRNVVRAGMWNFESQNLCIVRDGIPYLFHMHTPLRDREPETRMGFPMFGGEDIAHSGSGAWNLPYIWEAGEEYGVTPALLAGYSNALAVTLRDTCMTHKNGRAWPRAHVDSPWYLAAADKKHGLSAGTKGRYATMMAFAPDVIPADEPFTKTGIAEDESNLSRLYAGALYREWASRRVD
ncbi:MAG: SGNH/GDSL hydrolase family protein [Verrucomicrobiota bacterium]